jgi:hypothetical protein
MDISSFFKRNWIHFAAIGIFLLIGLIYFNKQLQGYGLKQHDVEQFIGAVHETAVYREHHNGEEPLWTNSMFGGMPTTQISMIYEGNWFAKITTGFLKTFPPPMGIVLLYMICFYIGMSMMKVNRWAAIIGAVAFAFMTYDIVILQAGHNTKGIAIAYMVPVIGAFYMAYRRNWIWGAIFSAVFMAFEMSANHLQITYYMGFLLLGLGLVEIYRAIREKTYVRFLKTSIGIGVAYALAMAVNYGNIGLTTDYAQHTIRGANDLTIAADGRSNAANSTDDGLNRDYVTEYSYGIGESFSLISPYVKGAGSMAIGDSPFAEKVENSDLTSEQMEGVMNSNAYWGAQPAVSGPVYLGVILVLLALLGLFYIKDPIKYALLAVTILTLMLSWGKNYMGLTNWFLDNIPGYNKFRAVTIILVIVELCIPVLAVLFLDRLIREREQIKKNIMPFYAVTGGLLLLLVILRFSGIEKSYLSPQESDPGLRAQQEQAVYDQIAAADPQVLAQNGIDKNNPEQVRQIVDNQMKSFDDRFTGLKTIRQEVYNSSINRSITFTFLGGLCLLLLFVTSLPTMVSVGGIGLLIVIDLMSVTRNYLNNQDQGSGYKYWETRLNTLYPIAPQEGDMTIMDLETAADPQLKRKVEAGKREGENIANELEAFGPERNRIVNAYAFAALNENSNYRVLDFSGVFSSARASYLHKSLGGYHGAKLRSIQNVFDFHIAKSNNKVLDMLNVKYFLQPASQAPDAPLAARPNPTAMGNGWLVKTVKVVPDANTEILSLGSRFAIRNAGSGKLIVNGEVKPGSDVYGSETLQYLPAGAKDTIAVPLSNGVPKGLEVFLVADVNGNVSTVPQQTLDADTANSFVKLASYQITDEFDPRSTAIVRSDVAKALSQKQYKGEGTVKMAKYAPNRLDYVVTSSDKGLAVFSEIYYPEGWTATVNGKPADIIRVDYLLRGVEVPKGKSKVVFTFDLPKYHSLNTLSLIASIITFLAVAAMLFWTIRKRKETTVVKGD